MKKTLTAAFVFGAAFLLASEVSAAQVENLDVTPTGSQILIEWDKLSDSEMYDEEGYALQWGTVQNDIRNDKLHKTTVERSDNTLTLRAAGFDREETYYFRVYSYNKDGRKWNLNNGSKILKWVWKTNGDVESEFVAANDPVIVDNSSSSSDTHNFGQLNAMPYDTSIQFTWSRPSLTSSEFSGFTLIISENDDLSDPIAELPIPPTMTKAFIEGLEPSTQYYAAAYLRKGSSKFGKSPNKSVETIAELSPSKKARFKKYVIGKGNLGFRHNIEGEISSNDSSDTDDEETTATPTTNQEIKARIAELKKLISKYEKELKSLEKKVETSSSSSLASRLANRSTTAQRTTSSIKKRVNSIAERLRARLKAKQQN